MKMENLQVNKYIFFLQLCSKCLKMEVNKQLHISNFFNFFKGIITDCRITHATPAALYAHTQDRKWESDSEEVFQPFRNKGLFLLKTIPTYCIFKFPAKNIGNIPIYYFKDVMT